jgi:BMFP domain-containing protein YqiC
VLAICNTFKVYFLNKRKKKAQIESRMEKLETKATHDTEQRETTIKK